jgi:hypothetical protein
VAAAYNEATEFEEVRGTGSALHAQILIVCSYRKRRLKFSTRTNSVSPVGDRVPARSADVNRWEAEKTMRFGRQWLLWQDNAAEELDTL